MPIKFIKQGLPKGGSGQDQPSNGLEGRRLRVEPSDDIGESFNNLRMAIKEDGELAQPQSKLLSNTGAINALRDIIYLYELSKNK